MVKENSAIVYTDGSCEKNPYGKGGSSSIIFIGESIQFITTFEPKTTNQRAEMIAVIQALEQIKSIPNIKVIDICTDSAYVSNCFIDKWYKKWMNNGWKTSKGEDVLNRDLWERMIALVDSYETVTFYKVKGHSDNIFNNKCDLMAKDIVSFSNNINTEIKRRLDQ